jgi:glycosyltransferase involved in cell wall biosynthesis
MLRDKGVLEFVEAARMLKDKRCDAVFKLMGSAEAKNPTAIGIDEIREWEKEGIVEYIGQIDDVREVIIESDCVVLPSYREGLPRTLLEAASIGRPMVATDVPGCRELVVDGANGFLCKIKNSSSLGNAMEKMIAVSNEERIAMGCFSRKMISEKFTCKKISEVYISVIRNPSIGCNNDSFRFEK